MSVTKHCTNAACSLRDMKVKVAEDVTSCLSCGRDLTESYADLMKTILGGRNPWDLI